MGDKILTLVSNYRQPVHEGRRTVHGITLRCCSTHFGVTIRLLLDVDVAKVSPDTVVTAVIALTFFSRVLTRKATWTHKMVVIPVTIKNAVVVPFKFPWKKWANIVSNPDRSNYESITAKLLVNFILYKQKDNIIITPRSLWYWFFIHNYFTP